MDPINDVGQVMQVLRQQMAENLERMRRTRRMDIPERVTLQPPRPRSPATLRQGVARRLRALDANDPSFERKATSVFVESVLLAEFGDQLVNTPDFRELIENVATAMATDERIRVDLRLLVQELRR